MSYTNKQNTFFDVIVVGCGPAAIATSFLLAREGKSVMLLGPTATDYANANAPQLKVGESVPAAISELLQTLGLQPLSTSVHTPISGNHSFWAGEKIIQDAIGNPQGHGWRLNRTEFEADLLKQAIAQGVVYQADFFKSLSGQQGQWRIETRQGHQFRGRFIVDASGRNAIISRKLNIKRTKGPALIALWAVGESTSAPVNSLPTQTFIESQSDGWWYAAHLPCGRPMAIFHTSRSDASKLYNSDNRWLKQLDATQFVSESMSLDTMTRSTLYATDARSIVSEKLFGRGWAACGDAALSFDPISSQGIFNALASAHMLVNALLTDDQEKALKRYQDRLIQIFEIYQSRRQEYYRRAMHFHESEFWQEQT